MALSFSAEIRPLFRDSPDVDIMEGCGLDLSNYNDVKARATEIYEASPTAACPATSPGPRNASRSSNSGWTREWRRSLPRWPFSPLNALTVTARPTVRLYAVRRFSEEGTRK